MKRLILLTVALALALVASGCAKKTYTLTVTARLNEAGWLFIDESQHDDATLRAGDRLRWTCDCPEEATFEVQNIQHVAAGPMSEAQKDETISALQAGRAPAPAGYRPGDPFLGPNPGRAFRSDEEILSPPYRKFDEDHLWKFDWVVRMEGHPEQVWDPHFSGHKKR